MGLLCLRSSSQWRFKMSVNVCPDIFWTTEHFVTNPGMVMQHHKPECHAEKLVHCVQCQDHSKGSTPQWGAADTEIEVPSVENTELKCSPFKAWSRSVYYHTCYAYCQGFLPRLFLPFWSIHLHFFQNLSDFFPVLAVANTGSCVGPQNKIGHPAWCRFPCWMPSEYE